MAWVQSLFFALAGLVQKLMAAAEMCGLAATFDTVLAWLHVISRGFAGGFAAAGLESALRPVEPIVLYEYTGCPFCKKVREAVSALALDVVVYPTPRMTLKQYGVIEGSRYRPVVQEKGGSAMFPYMEDPNTGKSMYESAAIVDYLWAQYGPRGENSPPAPWYVTHAATGWNNMSLFLSTMLRSIPCMGVLATPSTLPDAMLVYWGYEGSPQCRQVHEVLCTLQLPYLYHNAPPGAQAQLQALHLSSSKGVRASQPYLHDPNTAQHLYGAEAIISHLRAKYQDGDTIAESMGDYSTKGASDSHGTIGSAASADKVKQQ